MRLSQWGSLNKIYALNAAKVLTRMEFKQVAMRKVTICLK